MRNTSQFTPYSRYIAKNPFNKDSLKEKSLLAGFSAMELSFIKTISILSRVIPYEKI